MNQKYLIVAGIVLILLAIGIMVGVYFAMRPSPGNEDPSGGMIGDPFGSITTDPSSVQPEQIPVVLVDGSSVTVPDFTKTDQPDVASATNGYQVAGSAESSFQILYFPADSGFLVTLNAEPLGETRRDAEKALRAELNLSDAELCKLKADVGTTYSVSPGYAGKSLGLSFCPGAVALP